MLNEKEIVVKYRESIQIPLGAKHRIENRTSEILIFVEVQTGTYFGEDDIIRLEDDYARKCWVFKIFVLEKYLNRD